MACACLALLTIGFAVGLHIHRMSGIAFTNDDDLNMGLIADRIHMGGWWSNYSWLASHYAALQGRIYFYLSMFFFVLPFWIRSILWRAILAGLLQLATACAAAAVLRQYAGFRSALLFVALACCWLPYWLAVSPITGYPFIYHMPVLLFFAGLAVWIHLTRGRGKPRGAFWRAGFGLAWSAVFLSLFFYEAVIPPFFLIALAVSAAEALRDPAAGKSGRRSSVTRSWVPWLVCFGLWAALYLGFRWLHPSVYEGSAVAGLGHGKLGSAATALFYFEAYSLPGANWFGSLRYADVLHLSGSTESLGRFFLRNLTADGMALAVLLAALVVLGSWVFRRENGARPGAWKAAALALACALIFPLPLVFTAKYSSLNEVLRAAPYLPGYYSFLAWCAVFALVFPLLLSAVSRTPWRWPVTVLLAAVCAIVSVASATTDDAIARRFAELSDKWRMVDLLDRSGWFAALPANSVFLAPSLWNDIPTNWQGDVYWSTYFSSRAHRPLQVIRLPLQVPELLRRHAPVFYCEHQWLPGRQDAVLAVEPIVSISPAGLAVSDSVLVISPVDPAGMALEYRSQAPDPAGAGLRHARIPQWREEHGAYTARLALPDLIAGTARVTDGDEASPPLALPPIPVLEFGRGFSAATEHGGGQYWRWSDGPDGAGEMHLYNPSVRPATVRFRASLRFHPGPQGSAQFDLLEPQGQESITASPGDTLERTWRLAPGDNRILVKCHAGRMETPGDSRYIVFGVWNWSVVPVE